MQIPNYTIKQVIGQGGMATVYLADDEKFKSPVAVKVLKKEFVHNDNIRKRFLAEARSMFKMSHPNIIKVTDLVDDGDLVAFVMEYTEGQTLKQYLDAKGKLSDEEIKKLFVQMLDAVGYVHEQGLIHRDIKPSNFMISAKGNVKLLDFGIAKNTDITSSEYTMTGTTQNMGTPMYMSPEQIKSTKDVTHQTDIYSLGVVLWQMVAGRKPYDSNELSVPEIQVSILKEDLPLTKTKWDDIIKIAMQKSADLRYKNCTMMKEDIVQSKIRSNIIPKENELDERTVVDNFSTEKKQNVKSKSSSQKKEEIDNGFQNYTDIDNQKIVDINASPKPVIHVTQISSKTRESNSGNGFNPIVLLFLGIVIVAIIIGYNNSSSYSSYETIYPDSTEYNFTDSTEYNLGIEDTTYSK
jgi:serine/threonine protein kinase